MSTMLSSGLSSAASGIGAAASGVGGALSSAAGSAGQIVEGARPAAEFVGPMPGERAGASGVLGGLAGGFDKMQGFASFLGDTPEEREKNAKAFSALVKDIGGIGKAMSDSTLMQRMMKEQAGGMTMISEGGGGASISPIPRTFDPATAGQIMSQLGYK